MTDAARGSGTAEDSRQLVTPSENCWGQVLQSDTLLQCKT